MNELMEALQPVIVNALLTILTGVIGAVGIWVSSFLKSKLNSNQLALLEDIASDVVLSIEQSTYGTELAENATAKKSQAIALMNSFLAKYKITLNEEQIDAAIEAAVANVINANKLIEPPKVVEVAADMSQGDGFANG